MATYLRPRKDGCGVSECSSPDELVGKGRCIHILTDLNEKPLEITRVSRGIYEIVVNEDSMSIQAKKETIINFFNSMPKLTEEKQKKIIDFLSEE